MMMLDSQALDKLAGSDRGKLVELAKVAEQAERYEDMALAMAKLVKESTDKLNTEERNLLSVAFKNVVGGLRSAWRIMSSLHEKAQSAGEDEKKLKMISDYSTKIEKELEERCNEVLVSGSVVDLDKFPFRNIRFGISMSMPFVLTALVLIFTAISTACHRDDGPCSGCTSSDCAAMVTVVSACQFFWCAFSKGHPCNANDTLIYEWKSHQVPWESKT